MVVQDDRLTTLNLLNLQIIGSFIGIIGLSVFILTSYRAENILLTSSPSGGNLSTTLSLDIAAFVGRVLLVTAGFIGAKTSTIRLNQLTQKVLRKEPLDGTLSPNIWITIGSWTALTGGIMALVGDYIRVLQLPPRLPVQ